MNMLIFCIFLLVRKPSKQFFLKIQPNARNFVSLNILEHSQTCVQRPPLGPKKVAVVDRWSLFRGHLYNKTSVWDLKIVVVVDMWLLFGGGL
jgi:hypothetical protein